MTQGHVIVECLNLEGIVSLIERRNRNANGKESKTMTDHQVSNGIFSIKLVHVKPEITNIKG